METENTNPSDVTTNFNDVITFRVDRMVFNVKYELVAPLFLLMMFTCVANLVVILCIRTHRPLQKPNNYFVISLAIADALVGLLVMSGMLIYTCYGLWPLSNVWCTAWVISDFSNCTVSMIHLCLIAHDRHLALAKPLEYRHSHRARTICIHIGLTWTVAVLVWIPVVVSYRVTQELVAYDCYLNPGKLYTLMQSIFVYFVPLTLMLVFYVQCLLGLRAQYHKITATLNNFPGTQLPDVDDHNTLSIIDTNSTFPNQDDGTTTNVACSNPSSTAQASNKIRIQKKARRRHEHTRSIRTLGIIIVMFLICWLPFCIFWPLHGYCPDCIPAEWYECSYWLTYINSTINPILYFLSNKDFRTAFAKLVNRLR